MHKLMKGYQSFYQNYFESNKDLYTKLIKEGQKPTAAVVCCSDSRTDPAMIFDAKPGDLFVIRNIANWVPPYAHFTEPCSVSAALAFAILHLNIKDIIILGHSHCAGVKTMHCDNVNIAQPVREWVKIMKKESKDEHNKIQNNVLNAWKNLQTFPWINESIRTYAWCFCMDSGKIEKYNTDSDKFD